VTAAKIPKGPISAAELASLKEQMWRDDPEYRAEFEAAEQARREREQALRQAEQPIVADLREAGVEVDSVWIWSIPRRPTRPRCRC
jgi:hypothetical protein